jgi:hypothetical protein
VADILDGKTVALALGGEFEAVGAEMNRLGYIISERSHRQQEIRPYLFTFVKQETDNEGVQS